MENKSKKPGFEEALSRLEEIVRALETGNTPLDRSLELYEEGITLVKSCESELKKVEKKIKILTSDQNGNMTEEDFE